MHWKHKINFIPLSAENKIGLKNEPSCFVTEILLLLMRIHPPLLTLLKLRMISRHSLVRRFLSFLANLPRKVNKIPNEGQQQKLKLPKTIANCIAEYNISIELPIFPKMGSHLNYKVYWHADKK